MQITINGQHHDVQADLSVQELVAAQLDLSTQRYAVELNRVILPRSQYLQTKLCAGDQIEIIHAVGGG